MFKKIRGWFRGLQGHPVEVVTCSGCGALYIPLPPKRVKCPICRVIHN